MDRGPVIHDETFSPRRAPDAGAEAFVTNYDHHSDTELDRTALEAALRYAARGWPIFPCRWQGLRRKHPLTAHGHLEASTDAAVTTAWWRRWPDALIGVATGQASGFVVLDIDVKYADRYGFDTLDALGFAMLPETPMAHTASGGLHLYFLSPLDVEIGCTASRVSRAWCPRRGSAAVV